MPHKSGYPKRGQRAATNKAKKTMTKKKSKPKQSK